MLSQAKLKLLRKLESRKQRHQLGLFKAEGLKVVKELLSSAIKVQSIFVAQSYAKQAEIDFQAVDCMVISDSDFKQISSQQNPEGVLAIAEIPSNEALLDFNQPIFFFHELNDPGNLGTILRTLEWFGWKNCVLSPGSVDLWNEKVVQSAKGSLFRQQPITMSLEELLARCQEHSYNIVATEMHGSALHQYPLHSKLLMLFGSEANGLPAEYLKMAHTTISIQGVGQTESLNVAVAASVVAYALYSTLN